MGLLPRVGRRRCTPADVPGDPVGHKAVDKCGDEGGVIDSIRAAEPDVVPHLIPCVGEHGGKSRLRSSFVITVVVIFVRHWDEPAAVRAHQAPPTETELDGP
jgi:hypothetical protein